MQLVFSIDVVQFHQLSDDERDGLEKFVATDDAWLVDNNAVLADEGTPVLQYRVSQLMNALYQLAAVWLATRYSDRLVRYLELLRVRVGQLVNFTYGSSIHDVEELRVCVDQRTREYQLSSQGLRLTAPVLADMLKRVVCFATFAPAPVDRFRDLIGGGDSRALTASTSGRRCWRP